MIIEVVSVQIRFVLQSVLKLLSIQKMHAYSSDLREHKPIKCDNSTRLTNQKSDSSAKLTGSGSDSES